MPITKSSHSVSDPLAFSTESFQLKINSNHSIFSGSNFMTQEKSKATEVCHDFNKRPRKHAHMCTERMRKGKRERGKWSKCLWTKLQWHFKNYWQTLYSSFCLSSLLSYDHTIDLFKNFLNVLTGSYQSNICAFYSHSCMWCFSTEWFEFKVLFQAYKNKLKHIGQVYKRWFCFCLR